MLCFLNFLRTGHYIRSNGYIYERVTDGVWWSTAAGSATNGHRLATRSAYVYPQSNSNRAHGNH